METQRTITEWAAHVGINAAPARAVSRAGEELQEAIDAIATGDMASAGGELADVAICLYVAASEMGIDLQAAIDAKMAINRSRTWRRDATGCIYHVKAME